MGDIFILTINFNNEALKLDSNHKLESKDKSSRIHYNGGDKNLRLHTINSSEMF
jgi:hypothetical protein|tara:strand:+ start:812 stop:973 length:162 start_codon:yes stop_codon:yes gene_type:complete